MWTKATFRTTDNEFTIYHDLDGTTMEKAFDWWTQEDPFLTERSFIYYLNSKGEKHAMSIEDFMKMQQPAKTVTGEITDNSVMPFGKFKGKKKMVELSASYLIALWDKGWITHDGVKKYVSENIQGLLSEAKKEGYGK